MKPLNDYIRTVPHWPKEGIMFRDITTLLKDPEGFQECINQLVKRYQDEPIDYFVGIESRGFILASALSYRLNKGFIPIRKKGKLPAETIAQEYALEYGTDTIEIHKDALEKGNRVVLIDDLIATGGTAVAASDLLAKLGADIHECSFVIDLPALGGCNKLQEKGLTTFVLTSFDGE